MAVKQLEMFNTLEEAKTANAAYTGPRKRTIYKVTCEGKETVLYVPAINAGRARGVAAKEFGIDAVPAESAPRAARTPANVVDSIATLGMDDLEKVRAIIAQMDAAKLGHGNANGPTPPPAVQEETTTLFSQVPVADEKPHGKKKKGS